MIKFALIAIATAIFTSLWGVRHFWNAGYFFRKKSVYWRDAYYSGEQCLESADADSFKILDANYAKDNAIVFWKARAVSGADPHTFELLEGEYALDQNAVYWEGSALDLADRQSFRVVGVKIAGDTVLFGADNLQVFFKGRKVSGNPEQFDYQAFAEQNR